MKNQTQDYYISNADRFLAEARTFFQLAQQAAAARFGGDLAVTIAEQSLLRFEHLLPTLPFIGGDDNFQTQNLVTGGAILCLYQVMHGLGKNMEEIGQLVYETILPAAEPHDLAQAPDHAEAEQIILSRKQAAVYSQTHPSSYGWLTTFIEREGETFDWGVDYTSCGICKLFEEHDAAAFIPYICFLDLPLYQARGIGLVRTKTLARGDEKCDFRFNLRGEYSLEWTPAYYMKDEKKTID